MRRWNLENLPSLDARIREAQSDDVPDLSRVLTLAFEDEWSEERVLRELIDHPKVPKTFVAIEDGRVVATASYQLLDEFPEAGWVHWVGADPAYQGRGLGRATVVSVLYAAQADGRQNAGLTTDDPRLAAIRSYLGLGFEPDSHDPSHPERWVAVLARLETR